MKKISLYLVLMILNSCGTKDTKEKEQTGKVKVTVVNYPLYYFANRIGGDYIQLDYPIPEDVDPAYWIPDSVALELYQSADIIFANGANYAKWMQNVSLPASRIVNTSFSQKDNFITLQSSGTHSHGLEGEHEHTGYAFTTWLDFELALVQAEKVKDVLVKKLPEQKMQFIENFSSLKSELQQANKSMKEIGNQSGNQHFLGSHPVYQYLAKAYSMKIHSVHFEPNEMPSKKQWEELEHLLDNYPARIMLWEDEPLSEVLEILRSKGIQVVVFNPCGNKPENGDFITIMQENINSLSEAIKSSK